MKSSEAIHNRCVYVCSLANEFEERGLHPCHWQHKLTEKHICLRTWNENQHELGMMYTCAYQVGCNSS